MEDSQSGVFSFYIKLHQVDAPYINGEMLAQNNVSYKCNERKGLHLIRIKHTAKPSYIDINKVPKIRRIPYAARCQLHLNARHWIRTSDNFFEGSPGLPRHFPFNVRGYSCNNVRCSYSSCNEVMHNLISSGLFQGKLLNMKNVRSKNYHAS